jgi:hypothetical protein
VKTKACAAGSNYLICPICRRGKIIAEDNAAADDVIFLIPPGSKQKARWHIKCGVCKSQIGISLKR